MPTESPSAIPLSELAARISDVLGEQFGGKVFWVIADISGLRYYAGKNYYFFSLVEKAPDTHFITTTMQATAWSSAVNRIRLFERQTGQKFDNGIEVMVAVRVEFHVQYGLKLNLVDIDTRFTLGKLAMQKQATLQRLVDENPDHIAYTDGQYITTNQRLPMPVVFQSIALIASPGTDGHRDFRHELEGNQYRYQFRIDEYPARVQGLDAEKEVLAKLAAILEVGIKYDAVVIVRGGGSDTDLLVFDGYLPARAIARFPIPVITGIGHTRNESVCDLMAFQSLKTPTRAAAYFIEHNRNFEESVLQLNETLIRKTKNRLAGESHKWEMTRNHFVQLTKASLHRSAISLHQSINSIQSFSGRILHQQQFSVRQFETDIAKHSRQIIKNLQLHLQHRSQLVQWVGPEKTLRRGFALIYKDGKPVTGSSQFNEGEEMTTRFHDGKIQSTITKITPDE